MRIALLHCPVTLLVAFTTFASVRAANEPAPPPGRPSREELREKFKNMTPEERQARMKEMREKGGLTGPLGDELQKKRAEFQKFRESLRDLPPAEREQKLRQWRETNGPLRQIVTSMSPEEREDKRKELLGRLDEHLKTLKARKADGTITDEETRRLQNMERMRKQLESGGRGELRDRQEPFTLPPPRPTGEKPAAPQKPSGGN